MGDTEYASGFKRAIAEAVRVLEDRLADEVTRGESCIGIARDGSFLLQDDLEASMGERERGGVGNRVKRKISRVLTRAIIF